MWWEVTLLYFFSWNCTWFEQNEPIKVQNFRLSTAHVKFHQICTLIGSLKYNILAKKYRGVVSHDPEDWCKIWKKTSSVVSKMIVIWWNLTRALKSLQNLHFYLLLLCKVFNVLPKKVQRSYLSWHWKVMQNLKKTDLWFRKWHEYGKFSPEHLKVSKFGLDGIL